MAWYDVFSPKHWASEVIKSGVIENIGEFVGKGVTWLFEGVMANLLRFGMWCIQQIYEFWTKPSDEFTQFIAEYTEAYTGEKVDVEKLKVEPTSEQARIFVESIGHTWLEPMLNLLLPEEISPEAGKDAAERFLGVNAMFQMSAWLLHLIGDLLGKLKALKDLPNAISWSYGLGWLSWLVLGEPFRIGIADPLREYYYRMYTPEKFTRAELRRMHQKGYLSRDEYLDAMEGLGYDHEKARQYLGDGYDDLSETQMRDLFQQGMIEHDRILAELRRRGWTSSTSLLLAYLIEHDREINLREDLLDENIRAFRDGRLDTGSLRNILTKANYSNAEIDLIIDREEHRRYRRRYIPRSMLDDMREKGIIDPSEWRRRYRMLGYTTEDVGLIEKLLEAKREE